MSIEDRAHMSAFKVAPAVLGQTSTSPIESIEHGRLIYEAGQLGSREPFTRLAASRAQNRFSGVGLLQQCRSARVPTV
jgi:hypothetical protein